MLLLILAYLYNTDNSWNLKNRLRFNENSIGQETETAKDHFSRMVVYTRGDPWGGPSTRVKKTVHFGGRSL